MRTVVSNSRHGILKVTCTARSTLWDADVLQECSSRETRCPRLQQMQRHVCAHMREGGEGDTGPAFLHERLEQLETAKELEGGAQTAPSLSFFMALALYPSWVTSLAVICVQEAPPNSGLSLGTVPFPKGVVPPAPLPPPQHTFLLVAWKPRD